MAPGTIAATIGVVADRDGDAVDVHASAVLDADMPTAWHVLTDYDRYPAFIPDLRRNRVVGRRGSVVTVEQSGDALLWLLRLPVEVTFEIDESPPNRLESHAVAGSLRALTSQYELTPLAVGIRLDYFGRITPGFALLGPFEKAAVEHNIARQFQALADEVERQAATTRLNARAPTGPH